MTALIGGVCVGIIWGIWVTRKLITYRKIAPRNVKRSQERNAKLQVIINNKLYGKETERQAEKTDGPDNAVR